MSRFDLPLLLGFVAALGLALAGLSSVQLATAHADDAPLELAPIRITGGLAGEVLVFRVTNVGTAPVTLGHPHFAVLDRGVRLPIRARSLLVDGVSQRVSEPFTVAPGRTVTLTITPESVPHGALELSFHTGAIPPYRTST